MKVSVGSTCYRPTLGAPNYGVHARDLQRPFYFESSHADCLFGPTRLGWVANS